MGIKEEERAPMTNRLKMNEGSRSAAKNTPSWDEDPKKFERRRSFRRPRMLVNKSENIKIAAAELTDFSDLLRSWLTTKRV